MVIFCADTCVLQLPMRTGKENQQYIVCSFSVTLHIGSAINVKGHSLIFDL